MEKSICATLDLSKSLSNFSSEVTKCLELTNITEWNGKILEERVAIACSLPDLTKPHSSRNSLGRK
ncbi:hypothetical protein H6G97_38130 [Nostoc flagelliforme FACHB-838]|uniref:Transposase n=1 Tax=Nostoc flagelliforme FACHB-838 TaxID=2692904 RepID=A0ABR8E2Z8_9NOSO|nr:hypothetical protein [Nostoc flagelliforme]MBD2534945.1 hypothetical protein [Nostoc flagelliforme FACHB-838]